MNFHIDDMQMIDGQHMLEFMNSIIHDRSVKLLFTAHQHMKVILHREQME